MGTYVLAAQTKTKLTQVRHELPGLGLAGLAQTGVYQVIPVVTHTQTQENTTQTATHSPKPLGRRRSGGTDKHSQTDEDGNTEAQRTIKIYVLPAFVPAFLFLEPVESGHLASSAGKKVLLASDFEIWRVIVDSFVSRFYSGYRLELPGLELLVNGSWFLQFRVPLRAGFVVENGSVKNQVARLQRSFQM